MTAAALGSAGVRLYQFENSSDAAARVLPWEANRRQARARFQEIRRPCRSGGHGLHREPSYQNSHAFRSQRPARFPGLWLRPGYSGSAGSGWTAAHGHHADPRAQTVTLALSLTPYRTGNSIARYIVGSTAIKTALISDTASDTVTLKAGETVVYLLPHCGSNQLSGVHVDSGPDSAGGRRERLAPPGLHLQPGPR